jgi:hypothetical protein
LNNDWRNSLGCPGNRDNNCQFETDSNGQVRIVFVPRFKNSPFWFYDHNLEEINASTNSPLSSTPSITSPNTTPVTTNEITDPECDTSKPSSTTPLTSPITSSMPPQIDDEWKQLPNCDRFDLESCRSGSQISKMVEFNLRIN